MKTKLLKLSCIAVLLFTFFGCNDCKECENERDELKTELNSTNKKFDSIKKNISDYNEAKYLNSLIYKTQEYGEISQKEMNLDEFSKSFKLGGRYDVVGDFKVSEDRVTIFIPITDEKLNIKSYRNISTDDINAILIVLDGNGGKTTPISPITKILHKTFSIKSLGLNEKELIKDKSIKVIVLHDDTRDITPHSNFYLNCLKTKNSYNKYDCLFPKTANYIKPNEDGGDIIIGG